MITERTERTVLSANVVKVGMEIIGNLPTYPSPKPTLALDCKTVFFSKISKEIGKAWRKSLTRAKRASLTRS